MECGRRKSEASGDVRKTVRKDPDVTAFNPLGPTGDDSQYSQKGQSHTMCSTLGTGVWWVPP